MQKHLYFVCPTDHLEAVINNTFQQENYYFTSLGNAIFFNEDLVGQINELILSKNITEITFILSDSNKILQDALSSQELSDVIGLNNFYNAIANQEKLSNELWQTHDSPIPILSYYLNLKVKELQSNINSRVVDQVKINAKIFKRSKHVFWDIFPELYLKNNFSLN